MCAFDHRARARRSRDGVTNQLGGRESFQFGLAPLQDADIFQQPFEAIAVVFQLLRESGTHARLRIVMAAFIDRVAPKAKGWSDTQNQDE